MADVRHLPPRPTTREAMLHWAAGRAIAPDVLTRLLRAEYRSLVAEVMARVHTAYDALGAGESERSGASVLSPDASWRWFMAVYMRFHAGAVPWRLSFGAWPVMPIIDQAFLEATLSIPLAMIANRTMQDAVLRTRFPALARVPLDRNAHDTRPLVESWRSRLASATQRFREPTTAVERRFYVRMYDFDNPGWRAVREAAEPGRSAMGEWFDTDALATLVPPPSHDVAHADPIAEGFGPKMLTGLMRGLVLAKERSR
jgi:asparagine synthase (glutamine-hydrolysing)